MRNGFRWVTVVLVLVLLPAGAGALPAPKAPNSGTGFWSTWKSLVAIATVVFGLDSKAKDVPQIEQGCAADPTGGVKCDS